jgi:hypothetical protein
MSTQLTELAVKESSMAEFKKQIESLTKQVEAHQEVAAEVGNL